MKAIIGLGNPGPKFKGTRHNAGFCALEEISGANGISLGKARHGSLFGKGKLGRIPVLLAKPEVFMNMSGITVKSIMRYYGIKPRDLLIIYDEAALPLGRIRIRRGGSSGGHNGMESIIRLTGSADIPRLRLGIGRRDKSARSKSNLANFVLSKFARDERALFEEMTRQANTIVVYIVQNGIVRAMNEFN